MTSDQRHHLRTLIDQARRQQTQHPHDCQCPPCRQRQRRRTRRSTRIQHAIHTDNTTVTHRAQVRLVMTLLENAHTR